MALLRRRSGGAHGGPPRDLARRRARRRGHDGRVRRKRRDGRSPDGRRSRAQCTPDSAHTAVGAWASAWPARQYRRVRAQDSAFDAAGRKAAALPEAAVAVAAPPALSRPAAARPPCTAAAGSRAAERRAEVKPPTSARAPSGASGRRFLPCSKTSRLWNSKARQPWRPPRRWRPGPPPLGRHARRPARMPARGVHVAHIGRVRATRRYVRDPGPRHPPARRTIRRSSGAA